MAATVLLLPAEWASGHNFAIYLLSIRRWSKKPSRNL